MLRPSRRKLLRGGAALAATKLFTPSIIKPANAALMFGKAGGGGGGYVAKGVHFDGATAFYRTSALAGVSDSPVGMCSFWSNTPSITPRIVPWAQATDIVGGLPSDNTLSQVGPWQFDSEPTTAKLSLYLTNSDYSGDVKYNPVPEPLLSTFLVGWHHVLYSWDTNHASGSQRLQCAIDGVLFSTVIEFHDGGAFDVNCSALCTTVGAEGWTNSGTEILVPWRGDLSQLYVNFSTSLDLGIQANIDRFIIAGKPVNPSGFPSGAAMLFDGDATSFSDNQGTGGDFVLTGTLTNAATSPSD